MIKKVQIEEEWRDSDGYWIALKSGWEDMSNPTCHTIVENTKREAYYHEAVPCVCQGCLRDAERIKIPTFAH